MYFSTLVLVVYHVSISAEYEVTLIVLFGPQDILIRLRVFTNVYWRWKSWFTENFILQLHRPSITWPVSRLPSQIHLPTLRLYDVNYTNKYIFAPCARYTGDPNIYPSDTVLEQGETAKAAVLFQRALETNEIVFGKEHPDIARNLNNLGRAFKEMGRRIFSVNLERS